MENNFGDASAQHDPSAARLLSELDADRARLSRRVVAPRWVAPAYGALAGLQVARVWVADSVVAPFWLPTLLTVGVLIAVVYFRATGVKVSTWPVAAWVYFSYAVLVTLALSSVALGLASFDLTWWIVLPVLGTVGAVTFLVGRLVRAVADRVGRVA